MLKIIFCSIFCLPFLEKNIIECQNFTFSAFWGEVSSGLIESGTPDRMSLYTNSLIVFVFSCVNTLVEKQQSFIRFYMCHSPFLCQSFVPSDRGRDLLQDEDHSGSRPHSFPGLYLMRPKWAPEWFRSHLVVVGS